MDDQGDTSSTPLQKLRKALRYWQNLQLDYEGLSDEMKGLDQAAGKDACLEAARDFAPQEVDEAEILQIIQPKQDQTRTPSQIIHVLKQRSEYVSRNVASLQAQISRLEQETTSTVSDEDDAEDLTEQDLPHIDIIEQLDEEGNVLESKVLPQSEAAAATLKVLDEASIDSQQQLPEEPRRPFAAKTQNQARTSSSRITELSDESDEDESISENVKSAPQIQPTNPNDTEQEAQLRQEMLQYGLGEVGNIVAELELADDSDEDAEGIEDIPEDPAWDEDDDDDFFSDETSDEEDEVGQSKGLLHTEQYRQKMERLQEKLGMRLQNMGPSPDIAAGIREQVEHPPTAEVQKYIDSLPPGLREKVGKPRPDPREAARKAAIAREEASRNSASEHANDNGSSSSKPKKTKKKVAFAKDLDIAPDGKQTVIPTTSAVIERDASSGTNTNTTPPRKKSQFKKARETSHDPLLPPPMDTSEMSIERKPTPAGPPNKIISDQLVEHETSQEAQAPDIMDPNDFDLELQRKQIALEHHQLRNKMIHEQGGYVNGGESENWGSEYAAPEVTDPETGHVKKISRFKAARMRP